MLSNNNTNALRLLQKALSEVSFIANQDHSFVSA